ncbi:OpgC domain-containing protein [Alsobacter sp. KACC 23698]|uniref:OpgC domain-containing protein n=1 Tax=Alsobacter sp. KACC 23698 TaxID=3149229 RepID=A0AAU7JLB9_9HYPH
MAAERLRIKSIDAWRGLALATIFVNHVPGTAFEHYTHKNFGFSDAAEVFVLLAGFAAALAYLPRFAAGDAPRQSFRMVLRAFQIYSAHIVVLVACAALVAYASVATQDPRLLEAMNFDLLTATPAASMIGIATLGLQPSYLNILPLYVMLLLMAPALMTLVGASWPFALTASFAMYLCAQAGLGLPSYPGVDNTWFFNPFAWQLLFTIGLCAGSMAVAGRTLLRSRALLAASVVYLLFALAWKKAEIYPEGVLGLPRFLWEDDKHILSLPRLLHVLALAYVAAYLPVESWVRKWSFAAPLMWLGRHSLAIFGLGTILAIGGQVLRIVGGGDPTIDLLVIAVGLGLQVGLAWALEWNRTGGETKVAAKTAMRPRGAEAEQPAQAL